MLVQLAGLLVDSARHDDVVCRIGGDEMALLLPGCSVSSLRDRAQQIVQDVRARPFVLSGGQEATVSVSVGLAHAPTDAVDLQSLYVKADQTLYDAKRFGPQPGRDRRRQHRPASPPEPGAAARTTRADGEADPGRARQRRHPGGLSADHRAVLRQARRGRGPAETDRRRRSPPSCGGGDPGRGGLRADRRCGTPRHPGRRTAIGPVASGPRRAPAHRGERVRRPGRPAQLPPRRPGGSRAGRRAAGGAADRADGVRAAGDGFTTGWTSSAS